MKAPGPDAAKRDLFRGLLREHGDSLFAFAMSLTGNPADAEDLTAEGFARALQNFHRFDPKRSFASWVFKIMHNAFRDRMRRLERRKTISIESLSPEGKDGTSEADRFAPREPALDFKLEAAESAAQVRAALSRIPLEFREPLVLRDTLDLSYEEVALRLGVPMATVRTRIFRGRKLLRRHLDPYLACGDRL